MSPLSSYMLFSCSASVTGNSLKDPVGLSKIRQILSPCMVSFIGDHSAGTFTHESQFDLPDSLSL